MRLKAAKLQCLRFKKRQILKIDNDQVFFCLFFRLVNFLIFIAKRQSSSRYVLANKRYRE
ncbi:hypothetical protein [Wolbachia endosymbiont of Aedes albopictus]|uniref:hypothetical protein n=1 Tax=Wolbachia endosymbiont of Aedes albopictus TaxID=167957 RepID=UPI0021695AE8|nr:hypothetical protein [Wolbachia endosymbiont of Aedes albopictus]UVW83938.1 hypothetical protein NHG98_00180 [Wolbachia endosymbiont of Aedes albopictus]